RAGGAGGRCGVGAEALILPLLLALLVFLGIRRIPTDQQSVQFTRTTGRERIGRRAPREALPLGHMVLHACRQRLRAGDRGERYRERIRASGERRRASPQALDLALDVGERETLLGRTLRERSDHGGGVVRAQVDAGAAARAGRAGAEAAGSS